MREILFRAKRVDNGEWIEGCLVIRKDTGNNAINCYIIRPSYVHFNNSHIVHTEVDPKTLSQFTGLLDKHGNKIWENDVVLHTLANKEFSVIWENGLGFRLNRISDNCNEFLLTKDFCDKYAEVTGNRFD